ncbi:DUF4330 family protein [Halorubrum halodurans]|uniref:DUF4330 domain-containing protein n=1 Tax=Halorubrum halodurans TaxID=1383851 RepID=A0A256ISB7_9EURY|nr:DUF4330 family protein [Halorubrum halodurans]OYR59032.1 hypothetical protein DJ70_01525 [Halorubrum halodurans]
MELIDDDGDLFGVINVVDALVVLLVLAVGVAGVALVFSEDPEPEPDLDSTYATLDVGLQPAYIVEAVNEGDTYSPNDVSTMTVTDVHLTPRGNDIGVVLRVELEGELGDDGSIAYDEGPLRLGRSLALNTDRYQLNGRIRAVGDDDALEREPATVVVRDTLATATAEEIAGGDEVRLAGRTVATIENVTQFATNDPDRRRVFVAATLQTHRQSDDRRFGGNPVRRGQNVRLSTGDYTIDGRIERVGGQLQLGSASTRTVTLRMDDVRDDMADAIDPGMAEEAGGDTVARVTAVDTRPSLIIATGDNGTVNVVDHPIDREVTLTTELQVRETVSGPRFKGDPLRQGRTVTLDLGTVTVRATVVNVSG